MWVFILGGAGLHSVEMWHTFPISCLMVFFRIVRITALGVIAHNCDITSTQIDLPRVASWLVEFLSGLNDLCFPFDKLAPV